MSPVIAANPRGIPVGEVPPDRGPDPLAERLRQQAAVLALGEQALRSVPVPALLEEAAARVAETLRAPFAGLLLLEPEEGNLLLAAGVGWREGLVGAARVPGEAYLQAGFAVRSGRPVVVVDLHRETRFEPPPLLCEHGVRSGASVALGEVESPLGVLSVHSTQPGAFTETDASFLQSVANVLALALRRYEAEEVLRHSEARYRLLAENASDLILELDAKGRVAFASPNHLERIGWSPEALEGRDAFALVCKEDRAALRATFERTLAEGGSAEATFRAHRRDGGIRVFEANARSLPDVERPGMVAVLRDVTARKEAEAALRESEARLHRSQRLEAVGRLAGGIAHDFNNMLTVIGGHCDILAARLPAGNDRETVEGIRSAQTRAAGLTGQLLAFGRAQQLRPRAFDLNALLREMEPMLRSLVGETVALELRLAPEIGAAHADPAALAQAVVNLVLNARDAVSQGGAIRIETANAALVGTEAAAAELAPGAYVALFVSDTGTGMEAATLARVFEPFFSTKPKGRGSGLGLASVYGAVRQSEGGVTVESAPGAGTTFRLYFPRAGCPEADSETAGEPDDAPVPERCTVLVCEDEGAVREVMERLLRAEGCAVISTADAGNALARLRESARPVDLLVTDVVMPGANGPELARRARALQPDLRLLYVSGYAEREAAAEEAGAAHLAKPFSSAELRRALRAALRAAPPARGAVR